MSGPRESSAAATGGTPASPPAAPFPPALTVLPVTGLPEITPGADLTDGWPVDDQDKATADDPALAGIAVRALPRHMRDVPSTAAIATAAIDLARELAR